MEPGRHDRVNITNARVGHSVDLHSREMRYLISMGIRVVCFIGAVVASGPLRWTLLVGAIFLPYVAVVFANNANRKQTTDAETYRPTPFGILESGEPDESGPDASR